MLRIINPFEKMRFTVWKDTLLPQSMSNDIMDNVDAAVTVFDMFVRNGTIEDIRRFADHSEKNCSEIIRHIFKMAIHIGRADIVEFLLTRGTVRLEPSYLDMARQRGFQEIAELLKDEDVKRIGVGATTKRVGRF